MASINTYPLCIQVVLLGAILCSSPSAAQLQSGTRADGLISGIVVSAIDEKPIASVQVVARRIQLHEAVGGTAVTNAEGRFTIASLADGQYRICAFDTAGAYINSCDWSGPATYVDLADGKTSGPAIIFIRPAITVRIRVNDVAKVLTAMCQESFLPHVMVFARDARGRVHPAKQTSRDETGSNYEALVPVGDPVQLAIQSSSVALETEDHLPVPREGWSQALEFNSPAEQPVLVLNAVGRRNQ